MKTVIEMAKEVGFDVDNEEWHWLERFADSIRADEREENERMAKRIEDLEATLATQTARIVDLQAHIENLEGEE